MLSSTIQHFLPTPSSYILLRSRNLFFGPFALPNLPATITNHRDSDFIFLVAPTFLRFHTHTFLVIYFAFFLISFFSFFVLLYYQTFITLCLASISCGTTHSFTYISDLNNTITYTFIRIPLALPPSPLLLHPSPLNHRRSLLVRRMDPQSTGPNSNSSHLHQIHLLSSSLSLSQQSPLPATHRIKSESPRKPLALDECVILSRFRYPHPFFPPPLTSAPTATTPTITSDFSTQQFRAGSLERVFCPAYFFIAFCAPSSHHPSIHPRLHISLFYFDVSFRFCFCFCFSILADLCLFFSFCYYFVFDWCWVLVLSNFLCFSSFLHLAPPTSFPLCLSAYILSFDLFRCSFIHSFAVHVVYCISIFFAFRSRPHSPFHPDILASTLT